MHSAKFSYSKMKRKHFVQPMAYGSTNEFSKISIQFIFSYSDHFFNRTKYVVAPYVFRNEKKEIQRINAPLQHNNTNSYKQNNAR